MRRAVAITTLFTAALATFAFAQDFSNPKPVIVGQPTPTIILREPDIVGPIVPGPAAPDARSVASDQEVGEARRAYRAQCTRHAPAGFCECVTAGVAQVLPPSDLRLAARTVSERINAQGDAAVSFSHDDREAMAIADPLARVEAVEGHYAEACESAR